MKRTLIAWGCALVATVACNLPFVSSESDLDPEALQTSVASTLVAQLTETAAAAPATTGPALTAPSANTPEPLPTASATLTPTFTLTPTPSVPMVGVTVNTNCRFGPGVAYDYLGALLVGETSEIIGQDPTGNFWYIRNPDDPTDFCWLWGEYAEPVGNFGSVPILTPPPSPTPTYTPTATETPTYTPTP